MAAGARFARPTVRSLSSKLTFDGLNAGSEIRFRRQEADDEPAVGFEVVEVAGLGEYAFGFQKMNGPFFFGASAGRGDDGVPAAFDVERAENGLLQRAQVCLRARLDLRADLFAFGEQGGEGVLDGRRHR